MKTAPYYPISISLPRVSRGRNGLLEVNKALEKIERVLRCLPVYECFRCGCPNRLESDNPPLCGICEDCWVHDEGICDVEFTERHHVEVRRVWASRYLFMKSELATGRDIGKNHSPLYVSMNWKMLCSLESVFGVDVIGGKYISPNALRWNSSLGLVPVSLEVIPSVGDFNGWKRVWSDAWKIGLFAIQSANGSSFAHRPKVAGV
jgi:hypothetical protein